MAAIFVLFIVFVKIFCDRKGPFATFVSFFETNLLARK